MFFFVSSTNAAPKEPSRPRILGIAIVRILSRDLSGSKDFYSRVLTEDHPCVWCGQTSKNTFSVNYLQYIQLAALPPTAPSNLVDEITFETDDVPALWKYLTSQGVNATSVDMRLYDNPAARQILDAYKPSHKTKREKTIPDVYFSVLDPEGYRIGFVQLSADVHKPRPDADKMRLIHAGFVVHDRTATDHFYKDILGFRPYWHGGMKDDKDDWVAMQVPDGTDWVEYMLNIPTDADKRLLGVMNHIAIGVPDIQAAKAQLIKNGWKPGEEPKLGRDGKWQLNVYDPDDTRIEFMEFTPKEKPCCSEFTGPHPKP